MSVRVVLAPDKFKGSLSALEVAEHLAAGLQALANAWQPILAPVADGGDGTLEAFMAVGYEARTMTVSGSLGTPRLARYAVRGRRAVVELAEADGLRHLATHDLAPRESSTFGVGQLIRAALDDGCREIVLGVGGSASTDGGAGMVQALGAALMDARGRPLRPGGAALADLGTLDLSRLDPRLTETRLTLATDVDNPLLGPTGAAAVFAPQKGASPRDVAALERGLRRWADTVKHATGRDLVDAHGAGAAGGTGFAAQALLAAEARSGVDVVLDALDFDRLLEDADVVVTGEGSLDEQSLRGKAPVGVAGRAAAHGVPTHAVAGRSTLTTEQIAAAGLRSVWTLLDREPDPAVCIRDAGRLLEELAGELAPHLEKGLSQS